MTLKQLLKKISGVSVWYGVQLHPEAAKGLLKIVLREVKDGRVVKPNIFNGSVYIELTPEFEKFLEDTQ